VNEKKVNEIEMLRRVKKIRECGFEFEGVLKMK